MAQLFVWGANSHGQLGLGYENELCAVPVQITHLPAAAFPANIAQISGGGGHCLFLSQAGSGVYACGWNNRGQLGTGHPVDSIAQITKLSDAHFEGIRVRRVRAGWDCSAAIGETGEIFVWGNNAYRQLGYAVDALRSSSVPKRFVLPYNAACVDLHFGLRSTVFRTSQHLYVIGSTKLHKELQETFPSATDIVRHNGIDVLQLRLDVAHLSVGQHHISITKPALVCNAVQSVGDSRYGLGAIVTLHPDAGSIRLLRSGWTSCAVLTDSGDVHLWGRNNYAQIGVDPTLTGPVVLKPTKLRLSGNANGSIVDMSLGAEHGLIITRSLDVWTWGWNEHGNCGNGSEIDVINPVNVQLPGKCIMAATGAGFCYAIVSTDQDPEYKNADRL